MVNGLGLHLGGDQSVEYVQVAVKLPVKKRLLINEHRERGKRKPSGERLRKEDAEKHRENEAGKGFNETVNPPVGFEHWGQGQEFKPRDAGGIRVPAFAPAKLLPSPVSLAEAKYQHDQGEFRKDDPGSVREGYDVAEVIEEREKECHSDEPGWLEHPKTEFPPRKHHDGEGRKYRQILDDLHFLGQGQVLILLRLGGHGFYLWLKVIILYGSNSSFPAAPVGNKWPPL
jgi:hypothetical protein